MRTTLWRYHLGGGCALALAHVYLPFPPLRIVALVALCLATIAATLASVRLWSPARRLPFHLFAAGEAVGFVAGCALLFLLVLARMAVLVRLNESTVRELRGTEGVLRASLSERDALAAQLEHQAFHDSLTDLANRALFNDQVRRALARARRSGGGVAVLFVDLDDFKVVNDSLGHGADDRLLRNADIAMNAAKSRGKGTYEVFQSSMLRSVRDRHDVQAALEGAIERGELVVHYQPIVDRHTGRVAGAEALVRWPRPDRGLVPPAEFIPLTEESGLVVELDRFVLRQACRPVAGWVADAGPLLLHVNLSAHHLLRDDLAGNVAAALRDPGPAARVPGPGAHRERAHARPGGGRRPPARAQAAGGGLAIDDFGTGYSSLTYLRQMPIDAVKIDKSFVDGVAGAAEESAVARAIIALATTLHLDTVVEGVERPEQATALAELGCHLAQSYHFSRPIPAADMARLTGQHPVATTLSHPASATRPQPPGLSHPASATRPQPPGLSHRGLSTPRRPRP